LLIERIILKFFSNKIKPTLTQAALMLVTTLVLNVGTNFEFFAKLYYFQ